MITIRGAIESDASELTRLSSQLGYPSTSEDVLINLLELILDPDHEVYIAEVIEGSLVGFAHMFVTRRLFLKPFTEFGGLVIDEKFRGKGIGSQLLAEAESWAVKMGCQEIRVRSNTRRILAKEFYLDRNYLENKKQRVFLKKLSYENTDN